MINVWVTETNKEEYCLVDRATDRKEAIDCLEEAILTDGVVPAWVRSVSFYEWGDMPTEVYSAGDTIG